MSGADALPRLPFEPVAITAGRLHLRAPALSDAADSLAMLRDPETVRWNPVPLPHDEAGAADWCRRGADWSDGTHATFTVLDAASGRYLGNVSLHHLDARQRTADIGYRVAPWARGGGVASGAVGAVARWAFGALGLARVQLFHALANPASCRVGENAGFVVEGTLRSSFLAGDGSRYDEHVHGRLADDPPPGER